jgi:hypothetical protein
MIFDDVKVGDRFMVRRNIESAFTVTELTEKGFKYKLDVPYHAFSARWGPSLVTEGEMFCKDPELSYMRWDDVYSKVE